jgi:hypothetical protein
VVSHGENPSISLNDNGDLLELHNAANSNYIHYLRGHLEPNSISFGPPHRFDGHGFNARLVLLNDGHVMSMHVHPVKDIFGNTSYYELTYRHSMFDPNNANTRIVLMEPTLLRFLTVTQET